MRPLAICLFVPLVACGGDGVRHIPDARISDGPPEIDSNVDAAPIPVTLTITKDGAPMMGEHVYFQNADSSLVSETTTDATGTASAVMVAGGSVTAVNPFALPLFGGVSNTLDTWLGVKPGDHLVLRQDNPAAISFTITVPLSGNQLVNQYVVSSPCGQAFVYSAGSGAMPTGTLSLYGCGTTTDLMVVAENGSVPVEFFYLPGQAVADQTPLDLSAQTYATVPSRLYTYNNTPGTTSFMNVSDTSVSAHGEVFTTAFGGVQYGGTVSTTTLQVPTFTNAGDVVMTDMYTGMSGNQHFIDWAPYATTYTTDVGARLLHDYTGYPVLDPVTHTEAWTEAAGGVEPDFSMAMLTGYRAASGLSWSWTIVGPHGGPSLVFPTLPTDINDFNFAANEANTSNLTVGKVPGGYDAVRAQILALQAGPQGLVTGVTGAITYEDLAPIGRRAPGRHEVPRPRLRDRR